MNLAIRDLGTKVLQKCLRSTRLAEFHQSLTMTVKGGDQALIMRSQDEQKREQRATWLARLRG